MRNVVWQWTGGAALAAVLVSPSAQAGAISRSVTLNTLSPDDAQFFDQGTVDTGNVLFGITIPIAGLPNDFDTPDTVLATFDANDVNPDGTVSGFPFTINDDSDADTNPPLADDAFSSLFRLESPSSSINYTLGVTGTDNFFFDNTPHNEQGDYFLAVAEIDPSSLGGDFVDTDGTNETLAGADVLSLGLNEAQVAVNTLTPGASPNDPGDVDFYRVDLDAGDVLTVMTAPLDDLSTSFDFPDTMIVFFDDQGNILFDDDEAGGPGSDFTGAIGPHDGFGSALHFLTPTTGTYYFAVTAFDDESAVGDHDDFGDYGLLVTRTIPEPASLALLGLGGLAMPGRHRRSR